MENQQIIEKIENLKGRRAYEEKRSAKLGFSSLYEYFEDKFEKQAFEVEESSLRLMRFRAEKDLARKSKQQKKKNCGCC
jgi:hypothetical protein